MAIRSFSEYFDERLSTDATASEQQSVSKTLEFSNDGFKIVVNISLSRQEQHAEAIRFLRQIANELYVLHRATAPKSKREPTSLSSTLDESLD